MLAKLLTYPNSKLNLLHRQDFYRLPFKGQSRSGETKI